MNPCREVWIWNQKEELKLMEECLRNYSFISTDTEFPGLLKESSKDSTEEERYQDMSFSVNRTKLIQLGLSLFDPDGRIGGTWEINFSDFGDIDDARNDKSIEFLKRNGLDFEKIREHGLGIQDFFSDLTRILNRRKNITWVTFHGSSDIAYLLKCITRESLPATSEKFAKAVATTLGSVYDLKFMAGRYEGLSNRLGLQSLAHELGVSRLGAAHHAGSDSDLTARVFAKMSQICTNVEESEGFIYGFSSCRIISDRLKQQEVVMLMHTSPQLHTPRVMMRRCYGPPPPLRCYGPPPPFRCYGPPPPCLPPPQLRPMFGGGFLPFAGDFVVMPRVPMYKKYLLLKWKLCINCDSSISD